MQTNNFKCKYLHVLILRDNQNLTFHFLKKFQSYGHSVLILNSSSKDVNCCDSVININNITFAKMTKINNIFDNYDYIIWHGISLSGKWYLFFYLCRKNIKKFIWITQGVDLYDWRRNDRSITTSFYNYFGEVFRKRLQYFASVFVNDFTYWEKFINKHGRPFLINYFNTDWFYNIDILLKSNHFKKKSEYKKRLKILVGLDSSPFNQHIQLLNVISKYRYENIKIIFINDYKEAYNEYFFKVINYANLMFGTKVTVLECEKFTKKYFSILNNVDIVLSKVEYNAVHYDYQYESILCSLYLRKPVFLSPKSNLKKFFDNKKIKIYSLDMLKNFSYYDLKTLSLNFVEESEFLKNLRINIESNKYWENLFYSLDNNFSHLKFLHIIRPSVELSIPIMKIVAENFNYNEHRFLIRRRINSLVCESFMELPIVDLFLIGSNKIKRMFYFYNKLNNCDVIIWHGLYVGYGEPVLSLKELAFLSLFPKFLNKIAWVGWGIDLYKWRKEPFGYFSIKSIFIKFINKLSYKVRVQIPYFITIFPPDADSFKKQFGYISKAMIFDGTYSNPRFITDIEDSRHETIVKYPKRPLRIMIGHSANEYNDHFYLLDLLSKYRYENIKIYLPLSTGPNRRYAKSVEDYAKKLYGKKAVAINNKMPLKKYLEFLWYMDIVIFNIKHQAAVGNLMSLIYMCKKIYLPSDGLMYKFFNSQNVKIFDTNKIDVMNFQEFSKINIDRKPPEYVLERTDYIKNCEKWRDIFYKIYQSQKERMNEENGR